MAIRVVEFSSGVGDKIRKITEIFAEESTYPKEIMELWNFEFLINGELLK